MSKFGNIVHHPFSEYWDHEEEFSAWLAEESNIDHLRDATGLKSLEAIECEHEIEGYFVDILAKDQTFNIDVIVENQFGRSDHDHLGKAQTYSSNLDADVIIWIAGEFTQGHLNTIQDHNQTTERDLFAIRAEVLEIEGCEQHAFQLVPVAEPPDWPYEDPRIGVYQHHFFEQFVKYASEAGLEGVTADGVHEPDEQAHSYYLQVHESLKQSDYRITLRARGQSLSAVLEIDKEDDHYAYDRLSERRTQLNEAIDSHLSMDTQIQWDRGDETRNRDKISLTFDAKEFSPELVNEYDSYHEWLVDAVKALRAEVAPIIREIEN